MSLPPAAPAESAAAPEKRLSGPRALRLPALWLLVGFLCAFGWFSLAAQIPPDAPASPAAPGLQLPPQFPQIPQTAGAAPAEELRDIAPPVDLPFWTGAKISLALGLGLLLLAGLLLALLSWSRRVRPAPPLPDPRQIALRALFGLRGAADGDMEARDFAAAVAEVLRRFLEAKYAVAAPKQTTEEFLVSARKTGKFPPAEISRLRAFLTQCDVLKFAKGAATPADRHELLNIAESQVKESAA